MRHAVVIALIFMYWLFPIAHAHAQAKIPILLDFDIGDDIDDTFALATVLASPELELRGVTTVGEDSYKRAQMACRFLEAVGVKVPVAAGLPEKTTRPLPYWQVQYGNHASVYFRDPKPVVEKKKVVQDGKEKYVSAPMQAHEFLYQQLKAKPGELTIVAVGPLSNIAALLDKHPDCKPMIKRIVIMGGSVRRGYNEGSKPQAEYNIVQDIKAAQIVFRSGIPLVVAPLDATTMLNLDAKRQKKLFDAGSLLTLSVQALVQLWQDKQEPILYDPVAVTLTYTEKFCTMENLSIDVDDKGFTRIVENGKPNARVATAIKKDEFLDWIVERLASAYPKALPSGRIVNESKMVPRGGFPNRVHACEDFETDIEKRWWLSGRTAATQVVLEVNREKCAAAGVDLGDLADVISIALDGALDKTLAKTGRAGLPTGVRFDEMSFWKLKVRSKAGKMVAMPGLVSVQHAAAPSAGLPAGNTPAIRATLTQDFDDRQGEMKTLYNAVVFNPVPGPPMGKRPHISFRYFLKGTDVLRVQLYSLTNGYHRCLTLKGLEQGKWLEGCIDMRDARKPDGTGGPLSENERIDDIQFYCDPRAELLIDDIVLYDAADEKETRPFPSRFLFTAWFDTGKQGKEWPGNFDIAPKEGYFWHAAKSVPHPDKDGQWINIGLRGDRPIRPGTSLTFRYKLQGAKHIRVEFELPPKDRAFVEAEGLKTDTWDQATVTLKRLLPLPADAPQEHTIRAVAFRVPAEARLWIDDVLLYETGKK